MSIIKKAHITEKSLKQVKDFNRYTFLVDYKANKDQIKNAVQNLFDVEVVKITTSTLKPTTSRSGRTGRRRTTPKKKKAVVQLKDKQSISYFEG